MDATGDKGASRGPTPGAGERSARPEEVADQARDAAGQVVEEVQRQVGQRFAAQVERSAARAGALSEALSAVGRELRARDDDGLAGLTDRAADQVGRMAEYLRGKDLDEIVYEGEQFARRQPALFLGGAFLIGVAAARFLKSSGRPRRGGYGAPGPYGYPPARYMSHGYGYDAADYDRGGRVGAVGPSAASRPTSPPSSVGAAAPGTARPAAPTIHPSTSAVPGQPGVGPAAPRPAQPAGAANPGPGPTAAPSTGASAGSPGPAAGGSTSTGPGPRSTGL